MADILVITGGKWQVPLVQKIKEMGHRVYNTNLYPDSPAFSFSDGFHVTDVLDLKENLSYAESLGVQAVVTDQSDIAVPTVAYVADALGLPGIGEDKAKLFTNKYLMRQFCVNNGFDSPGFKLCSKLADAQTMLEKYDRIIIKPIDSQSSRGVFLVENERDLIAHFDETMNCSRAEKKVLAEEYIDGREFTVDSVVVDGKCSSLATSLKYQFKHNPNITQTLYFTNTSEEYDLDMLRRTNEKLVEAMGLPFGLTHGEYKYRDGVFYLIEIAARGGGTYIASHLVPIMSGVDNYSILIDQVLGVKTEYDIHPNPRLKNRKAVLEFLDFPNGTVERIQGTEQARAVPGVVNLTLEFQEGSRLSKPGDDRSRAGFFIAYADNAEALNQIREQVKEKLVVEIRTDGCEVKE